MVGSCGNGVIGRQSTQHLSTKQLQHPYYSLPSPPPAYALCVHLQGKTAQSIAVIAWLKQYAGASAPCMVVAPLTTLGHWKREIETWTDLVRGGWVDCG